MKPITAYIKNKNRLDQAIADGNDLAGWTEESQGLNGRIDSVSAQLASNLKQNEYLQGLLSNCKTVFVGIDSLTAGAGGNSYLDFLAPLLRGQLGDGSLGLQMFESSIASAEGIGYNKTANLLEISTLAFDVEPKKYSICGRGLYCNAGVNEYFTWNTNNRYYKKVRVFYLQQPGGGTFKVGFSGWSDSISTQVNTDGPLDLKYFEISTNQAGGLILKVNSINGKVAIFGGYFFNDDDAGNIQGVTISRLAQGGVTLENTMKLDGSFRTKWIQTLNSDLYILNAGMNDRSTMDAVTYKTNVQNWINQVKAGKSDINILLVHSNQPSDYNTTNLKDYMQKLIELSTENKVGFINIADYLGDYSTANTKGFMYDGVHPNSEGNKIIAGAILKKLGFAMNGKKTDVAAPPWSVANATPILKGDLTTKAIGTVTNGVKTKLYEIGLINSYPMVYFEITVVSQRNGTGYCRTKRVTFTVNNQITLGIATSVSTPTLTDLYVDASGGDFTITAELANSHALISITPSTYDSIISVSGKYQLSKNNVTGQAVYEYG